MLSVHNEGEPIPPDQRASISSTYSLEQRLRKKEIKKAGDRFGLRP